MTLLHEPTDSYSASSQNEQTDPSRRIETTKTSIFHLFTQVDQELGWSVQFAFKLQDIDLSGNDIVITFEGDAKRVISKNSENRDKFMSIVRKYFVPQYGNATLDEQTSQLRLPHS